MKCLSVSQPFAHLIVSGKKTIELRNWKSNYRGEILVHAPLRIRKEDCKRLRISEKLPTGVIVGKVEIVDVKKYNSAKEVKADRKFHLASGKFNDRKYGFILKKPKQFRIPIPWKGQLGFFDVDLPKEKTPNADIVSDIIDEEYRYQWIGHH